MAVQCRSVYSSYVMLIPSHHGSHQPTLWHSSVYKSSGKLSGSLIYYDQDNLLKKRLPRKEVVITRMNKITTLLWAGYVTLAWHIHHVYGTSINLGVWSGACWQNEQWGWRCSASDCCDYRSYNYDCNGEGSFASGYANGNHSLLTKAWPLFDGSHATARVSARQAQLDMTMVRLPRSLEWWTVEATVRCFFFQDFIFISSRAISTIQDNSFLG